MVSFNNFRALNPEVARLTRELLDYAARQRSAFLSFVCVWMAFNGWMESVTEAKRDAEMIDALADNRRLTDAFEELIREGAPLRGHVLGFTALWPVINVRNARNKLGREAFARLSREELLRKCQNQSIRFEPRGWNENDVPTWPQVLRTIYAIRCNLFHGAKSPQNGRDRDLILSADRILRAFISESGCFEWHD